MSGKAREMVALLALLATAIPNFSARGSPKPSFGECNKSDFYYNDCLRDNGLSIIAPGLRIARDFLRISNLADKRSVAKLAQVRVDCRTIPSPIETTVSARRDLDNVRCQQDGSQVNGATTYNATLDDQKILHWQFQLQFVLPVKKTSNHADVFLFMRTVFPRPCPSEKILLPFTEINDSFPPDTSPPDPDMLDSARPTSKLLWVLAPSHDRVVLLKLNQYLRLEKSTACEVLISGRQQ